MIGLNIQTLLLVYPDQVNFYVTCKTYLCSLYWCTQRDLRWKKSISSSSIPAPNLDTVASRPPLTKLLSWDSLRRIDCAKIRRRPPAQLQMLQHRNKKKKTYNLLRTFFYINMYTQCT